MSAADPLFNTEPSTDEAAECIAFVGDNQTHGVVAEVLGQHYERPIVAAGGSKEALEFLADFPAPKVMIVDIGDSPSPMTPMLSLAAAFTSDTRLIGIGMVNDIALYREIVGAGITDYLVKPVTEKALAAALTRTEEPLYATEPHGQAPKNHQRIAVIGSRGGVGATTIAVNLGWLFAEQRKLRTTLVDLDLEFGTVALALDLEPTRGLREALENPDRIDGLFVSSATAKLTDRMSIMATEEPMAGDIVFNPGAIDVLFEAIERSNDCIVTDLPRGSHELRQRVFESATHIVLVTELNLPGLRDSIRLLGSIEEVARDAPIIVVANRTGGALQGMQVADFQKALGRKVDLQIPEDAKTFNLAANTGKTLLQADAKGKASKVVAAIAKKIAPDQMGKDPASSSKKGLRGWLKRS
ncbi:MAG: hypothetical protein ACREDZ_10815 [Kiloniellales bacterium]